MSSHLCTYLEAKSVEHREDIAREVKTHGQVRPLEFQVGSKTWKSYSKIRRPSEAYRDGFAKIQWE